MAEILIRKRGSWMDKDDAGLTQYERFQLLIDNYKSGSLTPRQKWIIIQVLPKKRTRYQMAQLLIDAGLPIDAADDVDRLYAKVQAAVANWGSLTELQKIRILAWADAIIDAIPASQAIAYKDKLTRDYASRSQIGDIVVIMPDCFFCEPTETTGHGWKHDAYYLIKIPGADHEAAQQYVGPVENEARNAIIYKHRYFLDLAAAPASIRNKLQTDGQITASWNQVQPYLVDKTDG